MKNSLLSQKAFSAVRWTTLNTVFQVGIQTLSLIILGRILSPMAFGLMGMIMVVIELVNIFARMGLVEAIIHKETITKNELSSLYFLNVFVGLLLFVSVFLLSDLIGFMYSEDAVVPLVKIMSCLFFISSLGTIFEIMLRKHLLFDSLAKIAIFSHTISFFSTIFLVVQGAGVYALVFGQVIHYFSRTCLLLVVAFKKNWIPQLRFNINEVTFYLKFGAYRVLAMSANQFNSRVDQLLIGGILGATALGYYNVAFRIIYLPIQKINPILTQVALPIFARIQNETELLKKSYLKYINLILSINLPVLAGLTSTSHIIIPLFLSEKWIPAVPIVQALSFYVFIRSIFNASGSLIIAKGKANWTFYWNIAMLFVIPATTYTALIVNKSAVAVCLWLSGIFSLFFFFHYHVFLRRLLGSFFKEYAVTILRPFSISTSMGIFTYLLSTQIQHWKTSFAALALVAFGVIYYMIGSIIFNPYFVSELEKILPETLNTQLTRIRKSF